MNIRFPSRWQSPTGNHGFVTKASRHTHVSTHVHTRADCGPELGGCQDTVGLVIVIAGLKAPSGAGQQVEIKRFSCLLPSSSGGLSVSLRPGSVSASLLLNPQTQRAPHPHRCSVFLSDFSLAGCILVHFTLLFFCHVFQRLRFPPFSLHMLHLSF